MREILRNNIYEAVDTVLQALIKADYQIQTQKYPMVESKNNGSYTTTYIDVPDYGMTYYRYLGGMLENWDTRELDEIFFQDYPHFQGKIGNRSSNRSFQTTMLLQTMVIGTLSRDPELRDKEKHLNDELDELDKFLKTRRIKRRHVALIGNLDIDAEQIKFEMDRGIIIKELTDDELSRYCIDMKSSYPLFGFERYAVIIEFSDDITFSTLPQTEEPPLVKSIPKILESITRSVNLLKGGAVGITKRHSEQLGYLGRFLWGSSTEEVEPLLGKKCILVKSDIQEWKRMYKKLFTQDLDSFELALDRLAQSERRMKPNDSIIDAMIGLESLILDGRGNDGAQGELTYRFSMNYATLFNVEKREDRRIFARDVYSLRSKIVHGSKPNLEKIKIGDNMMNIGQAADEVKEMLRYALNCLIDLPPEQNFSSKGFWTKRLLNC